MTQAQAQNFNIEDLPPSLREIAETIGVTAVFSLAREWGGVRVYVPKKISENHKLAQTLGYDSAQKLAEKFGGSAIQISRVVFRRSRNRWIASVKGSMSVAQISKHLNLSEGHVWEVLRKTKNSPSSASVPVPAIKVKEPVMKTSKSLKNKMGAFLSLWFAGEFKDGGMLATALEELAAEARRGATIQPKQEISG